MKLLKPLLMAIFIAALAAAFHPPTRERLHFLLQERLRTFEGRSLTPHEELDKARECLRQLEKLILQQQQRVEFYVGQADLPGTSTRHDQNQAMQHATAELKELVAERDRLRSEIDRLTVQAEFACLAMPPREKQFAAAALLEAQQHVDRVHDSLKALELARKASATAGDIPLAETATVIEAGSTKTLPTGKSPVPTGIRCWSAAIGNSHCEATLVRVDGGNVVLDKSDGKQVKVPLDRLCEADRQFVAAHIARLLQRPVSHK